MRIVQIPILSDNYAHLVIDETVGAAAAVDPAEPEPVLAAIAREGVTLTHVLCTHHHWDHAGGNAALRQRHPDVAVVGSAADADRIEALTLGVEHGDTVRIGSLVGRVLFVPCHTRGHVAFLFEDALFCGDTLFVGGCGRFFEGDAAQMHRALSEFARLPPQTRVFCGHEYTVGNLAFARHVEPENPAIQAKQAWARERRAEGLSTVPSTVGEELTYNPFMRVTEPSVARATGERDPVRVMARLRAMKNSYKG